MGDVPWPRHTSEGLRSDATVPGCTSVFSSFHFPPPMSLRILVQSGLTVPLSPKSLCSSDNVSVNQSAQEKQRKVTPGTSPDSFAGNFQRLCGAVVRRAPVSATMPDETPASTGCSASSDGVEPSGPLITPSQELAKDAPEVKGCVKVKPLYGEMPMRGSSPEVAYLPEVFKGQSAHAEAVDSLPENLAAVDGQKSPTDRAVTKGSVEGLLGAFRDSCPEIRSRPAVGVTKSPKLAWCRRVQGTNYVNPFAFPDLSCSWSLSVSSDHRPEHLGAHFSSASEIANADVEGDDGAADGVRQNNAATCQGCVYGTARTPASDCILQGWPQRGEWVAVAAGIVGEHDDHNASSSECLGSGSDSVRSSISGFDGTFDRTTSSESTMSTGPIHMAATSRPTTKEVQSSSVDSCVELEGCTMEVTQTLRDSAASTEGRSAVIPGASPCVPPPAVAGDRLPTEGLVLVSPVADGIQTQAAVCASVALYDATAFRDTWGKSPSGTIATLTRAVPSGDARAYRPILDSGSHCPVVGPAATFSQTLTGGGGGNAVAYRDGGALETWRLGPAAGAPVVARVAASGAPPPHPVPPFPAVWGGEGFTTPLATAKPRQGPLAGSNGHAGTAHQMKCLPSYEAAIADPTLLSDVRRLPIEVLERGGRELSLPLNSRLGTLTVGTGSVAAVVNPVWVSVTVGVPVAPTPLDSGITPSLEAAAKRPADASLGENESGLGSPQRPSGDAPPQRYGEGDGNSDTHGFVDSERSGGNSSCTRPPVPPMPLDSECAFDPQPRHERHFSHASAPTPPEPLLGHSLPSGPCVVGSADAEWKRARELLPEEWGTGPKCFSSWSTHFTGSGSTTGSGLTSPDAICHRTKRPVASMSWGTPVEVSSSFLEGGKTPLRADAYPAAAEASLRAGIQSPVCVDGGGAMGFRSHDLSGSSERFEVLRRSSTGRSATKTSTGMPTPPCYWEATFMARFGPAHLQRNSARQSPGDWRGLSDLSSRSSRASPCTEISPVEKPTAAPLPAEMLDAMPSLPPPPPSPPLLPMRVHRPAAVQQPVARGPFPISPFPVRDSRTASGALAHHSSGRSASGTLGPSRLSSDMGLASSATDLWNTATANRWLSNTGGPEQLHSPQLAAPPAPLPTFSASSGPVNGVLACTYPSPTTCDAMVSFGSSMMPTASAIFTDIAGGTGSVLTRSDSACMPSIRAGCDQQERSAALPSWPGNGNVHGLLISVLRYIPYDTASEDSEMCSLRSISTADSNGIADELPAMPTENPTEVQTIPIHVQSFPCELGARAREIFQRLITATCGISPRPADATSRCSVAVVVDMEPRSETSFIALVRTNAVWHLIHNIRCRALLDRHGFWYAETMEQYVKMRNYCEYIRTLPQDERHARTDGLPCMPLVVEISKSISTSTITSPPAPKPFDEAEPFRVFERRRRRGMLSREE